MGIRSEGGWIYFNELLYRCFRREFGNFKLGKKMQIVELKTQFKLFVLTMKAKQEGRQANNNEMVFENLVNKGQSVNPFLTMMYYRISFNSWLNTMRREKAGEQEVCKAGVQVEIEVEEFVEYTSEEEDEDSQGDQADVADRSMGKSSGSPKKKEVRRTRTMKTGGGKDKKLKSSSHKDKTGRRKSEGAVA